MVRRAGLKCTPARLAVLNILAAAPGPSTHAEIYEAVSSRGFDRATIYRNLHDLHDRQLVRRVDVGDQASRFELVSAHDHGHVAAHPHFLCESCGGVQCMDGVRLVAPKPTRPTEKRKSPKSPRSGAAPATCDELLASVTDVLLRGRCRECR